MQQQRQGTEARQVLLALLFCQERWSVLQNPE